MPGSAPASGPAAARVAISTDPASPKKVSKSDLQPEQQPAQEERRSFWSGNAAKCLLVTFLLFAPAAIVVPVVCWTHGCPPRKHTPPPEDSINRLIVNFDTIGKTVKSIVPPLLYEYFDELVLASSNIQVVSFSDATILTQVRKLIESQPDLASLLQDQALSAPPITDPLLLLNSSGTSGAVAAALTVQQRRRLGLGGGGSGGASGGVGALPEGGRRALQAGATGVNYEDTLWQRPVVNYSGAWSISDGVPSVVVAVVDTGCDLSHPDLRGNLWSNPGEIPGNNVDDDGNGYVDDAYGYDFAGNCGNDWRSSSTPGCGPLPDPQDPRGHGTHCAGIVAALSNGYGVVGIAPKVKVMCLKVATSDKGTFYTSHVLKALDYALRMGAHIVSCSFGPSAPNPAPSPADLEAMWTEARLYRTALAPLVRKNMLIVAAAGNEHFTLDRLDSVNATYNPCFMAREFPDNMLCVMATDQQDKNWYEIGGNVVYGTNNGTKYVDLAAPGRQILSTVPPLNDNGGAYYDVKTGSSMATPLVAGVGALVLSVLGAGSGSYYQGAAARRILLESATVLLGLPTRGSSRLNASAALRQAKAALTGVKVLVPQPGFLESNQSVMMAGFNETYFAGSIGLDDQDFSRLTAYDTSARTGVSRFDGYKYGSGYTLLIRASLKFNQSGIFRINVSTTANASDLVVKLGQNTISPLNTPVALAVDAVGWYEFQVRYRNPSAVIDVRMADPGSGASAAAFKYPSTFYTATPLPPRHLYYAPNIALSSAFQVLTRPNTSVITRASILDAPYPAGLQLDQPFNYSSVLEDLAFAAGGPALRDALFPPAAAAAGGGVLAAAAPKSLVGMVHTRLRRPEAPMRFRVTCQLCSLYLNSLQLVDVYSPQAGTSSPTAATTRLSGCLSLDPDFPTHDLTLRFALPDTAAAALSLTWLPCEGSGSGGSSQGSSQGGSGGSGGVGQGVSITTHVASPLLWKPSSGVAGYVPGLQCDVWPDPPANRTYPMEGQPLLKFRLPAALSQSAKPSTLPAATYSLLYGGFSAASCSAANESFGSGCASWASFRLPDILGSLPASPPAGSPLTTVYMRCYTYVNRGFATGAMQARASSSNTIYAFLGSQSVFRSDAVRTLQGPFNTASVAPNATSLNGYYQLLAMEWRAVGPSAFLGLLELNTSSGTFGNFLLDSAATLLPIPVVAQRTAVKVGQKASARGRMLAAQGLGEEEEEGAAPGGPSTTSQLRRGASASVADTSAASAASTAASTAAGRGLLQSAVSPGGYAPIALGSSSWEYRQVGSAGLSAAVFAPNASAPPESLTGMAGLVVNNLTGASVLAFLAAPGGFTGSITGPAAGAGTTRYARADGFLRSPMVPSGSSTDPPPLGRYTLRVRDGEGQAVTVTMGNVSVRNAVEFPARTVTETRVEIMLPPGFVPTLVTVKSGRADASLLLDMGLAAGGVEAAVDRSMWYANSESGVGG